MVEVPGVPAVTKPELLMEATVLLELDHVPPEEASDNIELPPSHAERVPEMAAGAARMVALVV